MCHVSWQTWEGGLPSGTQPAGDQTDHQCAQVAPSQRTLWQTDWIQNRQQFMCISHRWGGMLIRPQYKL